MVTFNPFAQASFLPSGEKTMVSAFNAGGTLMIQILIQSRMACVTFLLFPNFFICLVLQSFLDKQFASYTATADTPLYFVGDGFIVTSRLTADKLVGKTKTGVN